jgi:hypothetical protein
MADKNSDCNGFEKNSDHVRKIVDACGGVNELSRSFQERFGIKISPSAVSQWIDRGLIPHGRVLHIEDISGIPCHEIRPDIYRTPQSR